MFKERMEESNNETRIKPTDRPPPRKQPKLNGMLATRLVFHIATRWVFIFISKILHVHVPKVHSQLRKKNNTNSLRIVL